MSRRHRTPSCSSSFDLVPCRCSACWRRPAPARGTSTACSRTRSTSRSSSTRTARRGSSTTGRRSSAFRRPARYRLRRADGRHGEGALRHHRGQPDRVPRLRLRARLAESEDRRREQHGHAGAGVQDRSRTSTSSASTTRPPAKRPTSSRENTKDRPWGQRQYMRVDWSQNLADPQTAMDAIPAAARRRQRSAPASRSARGTIR